MKFLSSLLLLIVFLITSSFHLQEDPEKPPFLEQPSPWADSVFASLDLDQKIGQLFSVAAYSNKGEKHKAEILELIDKYQIGGLTFFQGGPHRQAKLNNIYQDASQIPLMIAIDGEWGLSMRLDSTIRYPWQMTLGAIKDNELIYQMGLDVAAQFKRLGVHVNFAPVIDVNNNPNNPVINARSFGELKGNVAAKGLAYMKGMQDGGILANAKHFPGHGDTDSDSHVTLPIVKHDNARIDSIELFPFRKLIDAGVASIMTAHLYLPAYTKDKKVASSLSPEVVNTVLKEELKFRGLIFTDGLNMGGVAKYQSSAKNDVAALIAGNDILLLSQDIPAAIEGIKQAIKEGRLSEERINESCLKVLKAKEWLKLNEMKAIETDKLLEDLNKNEYEYLNRKLVEASLTVLRNEEQLPIKKLSQERIINVAFSDKGVSCRPFQQSLNWYAKVDTLSFLDIPVSKQKSLLDTLLTYDRIIISIHKSNKSPWKSFKVNTEVKNFLNVLRSKKDFTLCMFTNPYALQSFLAAEKSKGLVLSYQNSIASQELTAQLIFGGIKANGRLPVSPSKSIKAGMGLTSIDPIRLKYTMPEELGISSNDLAEVDKIIEEGMHAKAYPGVQVYIAKEGKVIYNKSFGKHTYDGVREVKASDLYDLASVTKIASTLLSIMELDSKGKIDLDDQLGMYLKETKGTPYEKLVLRDILAHQAGLAAWIPFYNKTLYKGQPRFDIYSKAESEKYKVRVTDQLFMIDEYRDTIMYRILHRAKVKEEKNYRYSDIGYYLLKEIVEQEVKMPIDEYNKIHFYDELGMHRTAFKPYRFYPLSEIPPTEKDQVFRKQLIHGDVHDPGAAMLGGVGGHAGLFSNANDLGKLMQVYLDGGKYAGKNYLSAEVISEYAKCQFCKDSIPRDKEENRRGAGFDKPAFHGNPGPTCDCISFNSFGHSGFTGTYAWVDPDHDLVYVFLSNRVYPDANNKKLLSLNIRTRIQEKIYEAINANLAVEDSTALNTIEQ